MQRNTLLIVLLAVVSLATSLLIGLRVAQKQTPAPGNSPGNFGGNAKGTSGGSGGSGGAGGAGGLMVAKGQLPGVPVLVQLPDFVLTERSGDAFGAEQLRGKVWVANFVFTRCAGPCPMIPSRMAQLQLDLQNQPHWDDVRLVSISVDPEYDTPTVLTERARIAKSDQAQWLWLTGSRDAIWFLIRDGFKLPLLEGEPTSESPIVHSQKFVLVDRQLRIRGYYEGLDDASRQQMKTDLQRLLAESN